MTTRLSRLAVPLVGATMLAATTSACLDTGPSTAAEVCASYQELAEELGGTRLIDNTVFWDARSLGRVAVRYEESAGVQADGELLKEIGDSDSTSTQELDRATGSISALCGQGSLSFYAARIQLGLD